MIEVDWDDESAEKGGYETFMLKEIYEQAESVRETIGDRARHGTLLLEGIGLTELAIRSCRWPPTSTTTYCWLRPSVRPARSSRGSPDR